MLSETLRKEYMEKLGYTYNKTGIKKMQSDYMKRASDKDGVYGNNTDILLKNLYNFKLSGIVSHFKITEFTCGCKGKYCSGYPAVVHQAQLKMMEAIRTHWGKPITVTCGLRCAGYNKSLGGSIVNSKHKTGFATDYYMSGVTDTLAHRKSSISWIKKQSHHTYTYGNGINSKGVYIKAPYMGNALHTDTDDSVKDVYPSLGTTTTASTVAVAKTATTTKSAYSGEFPDVTVKTTTDNAGKIVAKCKELCYPYGTAKSKWAYSTGTPTSAFKTAYQKFTTYPHKKISYSDCGYTVATIVRSAGVDSSFKGLNWSEKYSNSKTFKIVHTGAIGSFALNAGDIIEYKKTNGSQHTLIIYSKTLIAEGGREVRFAVIRKSAKYNSSDVKKDTIRVIRATESSSTRAYLTKGDSGSEVKKLQAYLNWYGGYKLTADGILGDATVAAIKKFQAAEGLTADGKFGAKSLAKAKVVTK